MSTTRQRLRNLALATALLTGGTLLTATPAEARPWPGHPDRDLVSYTVRPGDTATGLSVRFHAWTREFIRLNGHHLRVGDRVTIPVVVSAAKRARTGVAPSRPAPRSKARKGGWHHTDMSRTQVRRLIGKHARSRNVPVTLAQAVAWQESGWRQPLVSSAGAIGVMQVLPSTGHWMSALAGDEIPLRNTYGNVRAGTMLLNVLLRNTRTERSAVAAYYEGLGGIQNGWYDDTKQYVRSVMAIRRQLDRTGNPTG